MSGILMAPVYGGAGAFVFAPTISADVSNYNLRAEAIAAGWNGTSPLTATVTIASGVVVSANNTSAYAFDTGSSFPNGTTVALVNNGYVIGMGGAGGNEGYNTLSPNEPGYAGYPGGPALRAQAPISVTNNGVIGGGGGGGGGGCYDGFYPAYAGSGGRTGRTNSNAGTISAPGNPGTFAAAGAGKPEDARYWAGGAGGDWGLAGATGGGRSGGVFFVGGAGGAAVVGNASITWLATGTRMGPLT